MGFLRKCVYGAAIGDAMGGARVQQGAEFCPTMSGER